TRNCAAPDSPMNGSGKFLKSEASQKNCFCPRKMFRPVLPNTPPKTGVLAGQNDCPRKVLGVRGLLVPGHVVVPLATTSARTPFAVIEKGGPLWIVTTLLSWKPPMT